MELLTIIGTDETEELFLEIPESIINQLGWDEGTEIDWKIQENSIVLSKVEDTTESKSETLNPYDIKAEEINNYLESESEGKDFDQIYDEYINQTNENIRQEQRS